MIKKILLFIVVLLVLAGILYSMGLLDGFVNSFTESKLSLEEENVILIDSSKGEIVLGENSYHIVYDNILETYDFKGQMADIHEFDGFIEDAFLGENRLVKTADGLLVERDGGYSEVEFDGESKTLLNVSQDERIFLVSSDIDDTTNIVEIYDSTLKLLGTYDSKRMRVIKTIDSANSDGVIISSFSYEGSYMTSRIGEYLVEGMYNLWELDLNNELVVFLYSVKDGVYVVTNENLYKINNSGSILWTYGGYDYIKDCKYSNGKVYLLTGRDYSSVMTIDSDGKVEGIRRTEDLYDRLFIYRDKILISNSGNISTLVDGNAQVIYDSPELIRTLKLNENRLRLLTDKSIVELNVKID